MGSRMLMTPVITRLIAKVMTKEEQQRHGIGPRCNKLGNDSKIKTFRRAIFHSRLIAELCGR